VVIGDKRPYLTCLVMIDQENVDVSTRATMTFSAFSHLRLRSIRGFAGSAYMREIEGRRQFLVDMFLRVDHDQTCQIRPLVADHHGIGNVGREFEPGSRSRTA